MKVLIILFLFTLSLSYFHIEDLSKISVEQLLVDPYVEVQGSSQNEQGEEGWVKGYFAMRVMGRNKKQTYNSFTAKYRRVLDLLKRKGIVHNQQAITSTQIRSRYITKKRSWVFERIFVICGRSNKIDSCREQLEQMGIKSINSQPAINYLTQKILALKAIQNARQKLQTVLKIYEDIVIVEMEKLEIVGKKTSNEEIIESQIKEEFNESDSEDEGDQSEAFNYGENSQNQQKINVINVLVEFKVGYNKDDDDEDQDQEEYEAEENIQEVSDDSQQESQESQEQVL